MKILCLTHKYPPTIGGMQKQSFELIQGLRAITEVLTIAFDAHEENEIIFFLKLKSRIKECLREHPDIAVIHCNDAVMALACLWLKKYSNIPLTATLHGLDIVFSSSLYQNKILPMLKTLDLIITVSDFGKQQLLNRGFEVDKVTAIPNGVDHQIEEPDSAFNRETYFLQKGITVRGKKLVFALGRPVRRKGFSWFIRSVLPKLQEDLVFVMAGPFAQQEEVKFKLLRFVPSRMREKIFLLFGMSSDATEIRGLLQNKEINTRIFHLGKLPYNELMQVMGSADIFVMPNISVHGDMEGFGLVALESVLSGTPVLAAQLEGIQDAIHPGKNGYFAQSENAADWCVKIQKILRDHSDQSTKDFQDYTKENFSWTKMAKAYYDRFRDIKDHETSGLSAERTQHHSTKTPQTPTRQTYPFIENAYFVANWPF